MNEYYAETAYHPDSIPAQPASEPRSWLRRFSTLRLPWGDTQDIVPVSMLTGTSPSDMRAMAQYRAERDSGKRKVQAYEKLDYHQRIDHERYRYAPMSKRSAFWFYLWGGGRFIFWVMIVLSPVSWLIVADVSPEGFWKGLSNIIVETGPWFLGLPLTCWAIGSFVVHKLPHWIMRPSKGPLWELNRRTGMVTIFDYDNMGKYKSEGLIGEFVYPFHEFDAYIESGPTRQGHMFHQLYIAHRYRNRVISLDVFVPRDSEREPHYAGWDFVQNYMDISRPLPDIPLFEPYREQDPVTAEHDRRTGRDPRYWRDMDDQTWEAKLAEMRLRVHDINTRERMNMMAQHVCYAD